MLVVRVKKAECKKALPQFVEIMQKARRNDLIPVKKQVSRGGKNFIQTVWVSPDEAGKTSLINGTEKKEKKSRYGMHNIEVGDSISFEGSNGKLISGVIESVGKSGVTIKESGKHIVWKDIRGFYPQKGSKKPDYNDRYFNRKKEFIEPEHFTAAEWKKQFDDPKATYESVLNSFSDPESIKKAITETEERLEHLEQTITWHRKEGKDESAVYNAERRSIHKKIFSTILSPINRINAKVVSGEKPLFIMLGGRGGSGKSWFKGNVYDPKKFIVLDADEIKKQLPEFEGWNAAQVHEESSDIIEKMLAECKRSGLNVVFDATMKTASKAVQKANAFKETGYKIEAHYMHLPRQEAAKRAVSRFMGKSKRYVPVTVVLSNTTNEESFDLIKNIADDWSFRDNNVPLGEQPILISQKKK